MGSKESMLVAPILALAYDRLFLTPSWKELIRRRGWFYLALAAAQAAVGQFPEAQDTAREAVRQAGDKGDTIAARRIGERLATYLKEQPYLE